MARSAGELKVKVVPDLSDIAPMVRAEMARAVKAAGAAIGEVDVDDVRNVVYGAWHEHGGNWDAVAAALTARYLILERRDA